jgi:hypothetical protein
MNLNTKKMESIRQRIKDAVWELKYRKEGITVKNVFDESNGNLLFSELPQILEYLESVKHHFNSTYKNGFLELTVQNKVTIKQFKKNYLQQTKI